PPAGPAPAPAPRPAPPPPGPAFTIVSTAALLAAGLNVNTQVPCHSVNDVGGRIFTNVPPEPGLGAQPAFEEDFAHACGTAFSGLAWRLNGRGPAAPAARFRVRRACQPPPAALLGALP